jgi:hypothetical protein
MRRTPHLATLALLAALLASPASAQDDATPEEARSSEERRAQDHGFRHLLDIMELAQDKTSWSFQDHNLGSLLKFTAGRFLTASRAVVLAAEYETALDPVAAQGAVFMVGVLLSYFFEW